MDKNSKNREFHEFFHRDVTNYDSGDVHKCLCGKKYYMSDAGTKAFEEHLNNVPDYAADPRLVLREMMKREDWDRFVEYIYHKQPSDINRLSPYAELVFNYIPDTTGKLRDVGIEFMREKDHE